MTFDLTISKKFIHRESTLIFWNNPFKQPDSYRFWTWLMGGTHFLDRTWLVVGTHFLDRTWLVVGTHFLDRTWFDRWKTFYFVKRFYHKHLGPLVQKQVKQNAKLI